MNGFRTVLTQISWEIPIDKPKWIFTYLHYLSYVDTYVICMLFCWLPLFDFCRVREQTQTDA